MLIGVLYEHPEWFAPLFAELDRRGVPYARIPADRLTWDPAASEVPYSLVVNRLSPSAYLRGHAHAVHAGAAYLRHLEALGVPVVNGAAAYALELSKAAQLDLLDRLRVPYPRARVINHPSLAAAAAEGLTFPIVVKPNIGGSGAKIRRFESAETLARAVEEGSLDLGIDQTALVQELLPALDGAIVRIEILDGRFLYAIRITPPAGDFNLCPADICRPDAEPQLAAFCPVEAPKRTMRIEAYTPPPPVVRTALRIASAAHLDIGGLEYLVSERERREYFYDINALSNFVTDAPNLVGFDPFERFVDFLIRRASAPVEEPAGAR